MSEIRDVRRFGPYLSPNDRDALVRGLDALVNKHGVALFVMVMDGPTSGMASGTPATFRPTPPLTIVDITDRLRKEFPDAQVWVEMDDLRVDLNVAFHDKATVAEPLFVDPKAAQDA
jgi:hypothetical protein